MLTYDQAVERAKKAAALDTDHDYTKVQNFEPHGWVVQAVIDAAKEAYDEGYAEGYDQGFEDGDDAY